MNDGKNMAGMVSENAGACASGGCGCLLGPIGTCRCSCHQRPSEKAPSPAPATDDVYSLQEALSRKYAEAVQRVRKDVYSGGFCDRAAREQAKMSAAIGARMRAADAVAEPPGTPIGLDAFLSASANAKRPCCPCFTGSVLGCLCACHRLGSATGTVTLGYTTQGKQFSRSDILAILRGHLALSTHRPSEMNERDAIRALITIFENLE